MLATRDRQLNTAVGMETSSSPLAGEYAVSVIRQHYQHTVAQEMGVMADTDPEFLHQMRVGSRRLGSALLIFDRVVTLPKAAREPRVRALTKALGNLRDLDVEIGHIRGDYCSQVNRAEQKQLEKLLDTLTRRRTKAVAKVESALTQSRYQKFKRAYLQWFEHPTFKPLAQLPLTLILPELLCPLLGNILLHPGWLVSANSCGKGDRATLHELRKTCKYVRYQAEMFTDFYPKSYAAWVRELKYLQDKLGRVQDIAVFKTTLAATLSKKDRLPELRELLKQEEMGELVDWEDLRSKYLDPSFRSSLYKTIAEPQLFHQ